MEMTDYQSREFPCVLCGYKLTQMDWLRFQEKRIEKIQARIQIISIIGLLIGLGVVAIVAFAGFFFSGTIVDAMGYLVFLISLAIFSAANIAAFFILTRGRSEPRMPQGIIDLRERINRIYSPQ